MCSSKQHQEAQIGIVAVLLTTILLAIGVSVGSRVIRQTRDETIRQEATQQLNQAESVADMGKNDTSSDNLLIDLSHTQVGEMSPTITHDERTKTFSSDIDTVYLNQGETVEVVGKHISGNIFWELKQNNNAGDCEKRPGLLLTAITNDGSSSRITPVAPSGCIGGRFDQFTPGSSTNDTNKYVNQVSRGITADGQRLRIEALFAPTYVYLQGLTTAVRTAAVNQSGEEARAVEQTTSFDTPNFVNNFTLFAGNSSICQGKFEHNYTLEKILESDGKPGQGGYICK